MVAPRKKSSKAGRKYTADDLPAKWHPHVICLASSFLNEIEDGHHDPFAAEEHERVNAATQDEQELLRALAMINDLAQRYCGSGALGEVRAATEVIEGRLRKPIKDEQFSPWLVLSQFKKGGRRRRSDLAGASVYAAIVESEIGLPLNGAAIAVASVMDAVWRNDRRSLNPTIGKRLWGRGFGLDADDAVAELGEDIRKRAVKLKKAQLQLIMENHRLVE